MTELLEVRKRADEWVHNNIFGQRDDAPEDCRDAFMAGWEALSKSEPTISLAAHRSHLAACETELYERGKEDGRRQAALSRSGEPLKDKALEIYNALKVIEARNEEGARLCYEEGQPEEQLTLIEWLQERYDNCIRIANDKSDEEKLGWLEDASYFQQAINLLALKLDSRSAPERQPDEESADT
jgi:hypothetical protein